LPLCFVAGIWLRPNYPPLDGRATDLFDRAGFSIEELSIGDGWEPGLFERVTAGDYQFELAERVTDSGSVQVAIAPTEVILQPDVLLYWDSSATPPEEIGNRAVLLGALSGTALKNFSLPSDAQPSGYLLVYSRGQSSMLAAIPVNSDISGLKLQSDR
ncbi:MAG: hypothetical protein AAF974_12585, partial [Cyanobacteria bacterium P01_E01_bin.34]